MSRKINPVDMTVHYRGYEMNYRYKDNNNDLYVSRKVKKEYTHEQWLKRQQEYHKIIERDCYGYKKQKV